MSARRERAPSEPPRVAPLHNPGSTRSGPPQDPLAHALALVLGPVVRQAVQEALAEHAAGERTSPELLTGPQLDAALQVSAASRHRLRGQGMPVVMVGDSPRYHLATVLGWLDARSARRCEQDDEVGHA